jgi:hypothetical protein
LFKKTVWLPSTVYVNIITSDCAQAHFEGFQRRIANFLLRTTEQQRVLLKTLLRGLDFEHMIKARAHKGGVRIGKTPKKLASI